MFDKVSLVGFASNRISKYHYYRDFEWNSKSWREMIYVSENNSAMTFSRQYPNQVDKYSDTLRNVMEDAFSKYFEVPNKFLIIKGQEKYMGVRDNEDDLLYNDVQHRYPFSQVINKYDADKCCYDINLGGNIPKISDDGYVKGGNRKIW